MGATGVDPPGKTPESKAGPSEEDGTESGAARGSLSEDVLFEVLSNRRRRYILHQLIREGDSVDIGTLSQEIAAWEDGVRYQEVSSNDRKRVYTALQQSHLPKLDQAGVVDFDRDRGAVEPTPALEAVEIYMDVVRGREIPWSDYYLGLTVVIGTVLSGVVLEVAPFTSLPDSLWIAFVILALGASALVHRYYDRRNNLEIDIDRPDVELEYRDSADR